MKLNRFTLRHQTQRDQARSDWHIGGNWETVTLSPAFIGEAAQDHQSLHLVVTTSACSLVLGLVNTSLVSTGAQLYQQPIIVLLLLCWCGLCAGEGVKERDTVCARPFMWPSPAADSPLTPSWLHPPLLPAALFQPTAPCMLSDCLQGGMERERQKEIYSVGQVHNNMTESR